MTTPIKIDFVSDVSCPWCAIGLASLETALKRLGSEVKASVHFEPFELNPGMPLGGQDITEHLTQKYGSTPEQQEAARDAIRERGSAVGFEFRKEGRGRIYNTFNAHRLLHWAALEDGEKQLALKKALLAAYFTDGKSPEEKDVLAGAAAEAGLDVMRAREILESNEFADAVRERESWFHQQGINAVPAVIINDRYLIQGGQPAETFEESIRQIAREAAEQEGDAFADSANGPPGPA